ncbi:MAG: hypothetical protein ACRD8O_20655 [Bryobacteraceae bacterium]
MFRHLLKRRPGDESVIDSSTEVSAVQGGRLPLAWLTFERFAAILFFMAVACAACLMPAQNDTWWHLRAGKEILQTGTVQLRDSFSHTVTNGYWPDHEWLSQVIFYSLYQIGGLPLLTAFAAAIVTTAWAIVWRMIPAPLLIRLGLSMPTVGVFATEWALRPQIFTLLLLALTTFLLVRRRYLWLPLLFLLWANLHGGVMLGIVVIVSATSAAIIAERRVLIRSAAVTAMCALMTGVTPIGFSLWTELPGMLERLRAYGIFEWRAPSILDPGLAPFWLLVAAFVALVAVRRPWPHRGSGQDPVIWGAAALLPAALGASRNVAALLVLLVPAVGALLQLPDLRHFRRARRSERPALNAAILSVAGVCGIVGVAYAWTHEIPRLGWHPLRPEVIAAIESCPAQLYNRYDEGGYLIWFVPERPVFIDGRQDPFPPAFVQEHIRVETTGAYEHTFRQYSIRCAFGPSNSVLTRRLMADEWRPLYQDADWVVLTQP